MVTSRECKERAADCQEMAGRELNPHVRAVLNDMARSWERLAVQAAQFTNQAQLGFSFATVSHELEIVRRPNAVPSEYLVEATTALASPEGTPAA
jgi:hypothetical protein